VVDTNVLISGTIAESGFSAQIVDAAIEGRIQFVVSTILIDEYLEVIERPRIAKKYLQIQERIATIRRYLHLDTVFVAGIPSGPVVLDDPDDDFVLACAEEGRARYVISGDRHLLDLHEYGGARILTPREFVTTVLR
jgi:putative PIN family toxin of toxin-antitoxin system